MRAGDGSLSATGPVSESQSRSELPGLGCRALDREGFAFEAGSRASFEALSLQQQRDLIGYPGYLVLFKLGGDEERAPCG